MPGDQLKAVRALSRRDFLLALGGTVAAGAAATTLASCGSEHRPTVPQLPHGRIDGSVTDLSGQPQALGRIYLLDSNGLNHNRYADVDGTGRYDFGAVDIGDYQLRYWAGTEAHVPESLPNPVRITVTSGKETSVLFKIERGVENANGREIYAGDDFFQEQPFGEPNATVVVKLGTTICWYNVGVHRHSVTGGPWGDSGPIDEAGSFMWTTDRTGTFPYRCTYHDPLMRAAVQVIA